MRGLLGGAGLFALLAAGMATAGDRTLVSTGQTITPTAAPGAVYARLNPHIATEPDYTVGQAENTLVSPDGRTMLVLTSGYNLNMTPAGAVDPLTSTEFVFVFDISGGTPVQKQALPVPNSFSGMAWAPNGQSFYVGGGKDDSIHVFVTIGRGDFVEVGTPLPLHDTAYGVAMPAGLGLYALPGVGAAVTPLNGGMQTTADGRTLVVTEVENDILNLVDLYTGAVTPVPLRPGRIAAAQAGVPGGEFPYWVAVTRAGVAYVSSIRDREIEMVRLSGAGSTVARRIKVAGNPNRMVLNRAQTKLYVTCDNSDQLVVIDTATNTIIGQASTIAPPGFITGVANGAMPNSIALSPDERIAYVTNGGTNTVAVIDVTAPRPVVAGLIPTGWGPTSVSTSADGRMLYVVNAKSDTGPNPLFPAPAANQYDWQLSKAGFLVMPTPSATDLMTLTSISAANNGFNLKLSSDDTRTMDFLRAHIRHVIYIVKENRTYDQILGDLGVGDGDPSITMYGAALTPNFHALARHFVDLDAYYDSGICSMDGWQYSTSGRGRDLNEKVVSVNYGKGGGSYDSEGTSRGVNVGLATPAQRSAALPLYRVQAAGDPDLLPGTANEIAPDGPGGEQGAGYIWSAALRAGLSIRNYGFLIDLAGYEVRPPLTPIPLLTDPYATKTVVSTPASDTLVGFTDPYFRGFDNVFPDFFRYREWAREFDDYVHHANLPNFETVRFMHDHTGNFGTAIYGVNTPELQQADNDYAVGLLVQKIAHSPYAGSTLVFVTEDDSQDGPDHVDAHRSTGYVVGPYVKHDTVVSTRYSTVSMLRTMGDILGLAKLSVQVAGVKPMTAIFDTAQASWSFSATPASVLLTNTTLPIASNAATRHASFHLLHEAPWWAEKTKQFTFAKEDENDPASYNHVLWEGTMGNRPYPATK